MHSVRYGTLVVEGSLDGFTNEIRRLFGCIVEGFAIHKRAEANGCEYVACTVELLPDLIVEIREKFSRFGIVAVAAEFFAVKGYARDYSLLCAKTRKTQKQLLDIFFVVAPRRVFLAEHKARLGKIWDRYVGNRAKTSHLERKFGGEARVELSVVRHCGIDELELAFAKRTVKLDYKVDLTNGAEVSRVKAVEINAFLLPTVRNRGDLVREIAKRKFFKRRMV